MDKTLVVNASPLILLARIDRLDLLASLARLLVMPEAARPVIEALREAGLRLKTELMNEALAKVGE